MNSETETLVGIYIDWLREHSSERQTESGWTILTFPFLDHHNDYLQVYVRKDSGGLLITDDGQVLRELRRLGCDLKVRTKRRTFAEQVLKGLGLDPTLLDSEDLETRSVNGEFPHKLHNLLLSMLALDGLAHVSPPNMVATFKDDVGSWLRGIGATFEKNPDYVGRSGEHHEFDYRIPSKGKGAGAVLHTINVPDKLHLQSFAFQVRDTRDALNGNCPDFYAVLNDQTSIRRKPYLALQASNITPLSWSHRTEHAWKFAS